MKILWVSASAIGPAARILEQKYPGSSGVWIQTVYEEIMECNDVEMYFLCFSKKLKKNEIVQGKTDEGHAYCLSMPQISLGRNAPNYLRQNIEKVIKKIQPDIIQIWGTETCCQNVIADVATQIPKVVFLQGLIGIHDRYHNIDMKKIGLTYHRSTFEIIREKFHDYLFHKQAKFEADEIVKCGNVLVDNEFSIAYCKSLCDGIKVFEYSLNPRKVFEKQNWEFSRIKPHTIFTIYSPSQDKGLHQLLRAIPIVKRKFPDIKVIVPGRFNIDAQKHHLLPPAQLTAYEKLLWSIIKGGNIEDNIVFCGQLSQEQMAECLCQAHIFVNPSIMEVHAGALREAMLVGTPSISTYCGSVGEFIKEGENGYLYRYEEYEVLAYKIVTLINDPDLCYKMSKAAKETIMRSRGINDNTLYNIYKRIIDNGPI